MSDEIKRPAIDDPQSAEAHRLQAFIDGELGEGAHETMAQEIGADPALAGRAAAYSRQKELLAAALAAAATAPADPYTATLTDGLARRLTPRRPRWLPRLAMAAAFLAAGWWGHDLLLTLSDPVPDQVADAAEIHELFAEDPRYSLELSATESGALAEWMSRQLGEKVAVPNLSGLGLTFLGGRLLGREEGPFAQLVYEARDGTRVSLYLARRVDDADESVQIVRVDDLSAGYWQEDALAYTVVAAGPDDRILTIASRLGADGPL